MITQDQHVKTIIDILKATKLIYLNIITIICRFTRISVALALALSSHSDFVNEVIHRY